MIFSKITKRVFVGVIDFLILSFSLYVSLSLRNLNFGSWDNYLKVFYPFLIIIISSIVVFYMYGLYDKMTIKIYKELDKRIFYGHIISAIIGTIIFYTSPIFSIAPKTILIIYILISSLSIFAWRKYARAFVKPNQKMKVFLVAEGRELHELEEELKNNKIIDTKRVEYIDIENEAGLDLYTKIKKIVEEDDFNLIAINMHHSHIKNNIELFYELLLEKRDVINFADLYEEVFEKIPLKNIDAGWFFSNLYNKKDNLYDSSKRAFDLILSIPAFIISLVFYPFVFLIIKYQDGGNIFYISKRIGKDGKEFDLYKFRSMTDVKKVNVKSKNESKRVTKFGDFIRKTRIDELPQLINVIKGNLSLIGPRPEMPELVKEYSNQIAFYGIRHTIVPGLSGYAQIYQDQKEVPKFGLSTDATKEKLSYDVYYLKHRSFMLDLSLIIKTVRVLIGKTGL
ncbi:MAG: Bac transf protein [Patescibacteria group bacterium]|nr:Bac transf protein [Patescibacteria group bacterium]